MALSCENCAINKINPPKTILHPWEWPQDVFSRIHIDYIGPFLNKYVFIILDSHSKWIEVFPTSTITTNFTLTALHSTFARFGLPKVIVSDNAKSFTSAEFKNFAEKYDIKHVTSAPFFPQSNGAAENAVKTIKNALRNALGRNKSLNINTALNNFLFDYRNADHITTGVSPSYLMFGRNLRTRFSNLKSDIKQKIKNRVLHKQQIQSKNFGGRDARRFIIGEKVIVKDYRQINKPTWISGIIEKLIGNCTYIVKIPELDKSWKRHTNQIRKTKIQSGLTDCEISTEYSEPTDNAETQRPNVDADLEQPSVSRPKRIVKPPNRLNYEK